MVCRWRVDHDFIARRQRHNPYEHRRLVDVGERFRQCVGGTCGHGIRADFRRAVDAFQCALRADVEFFEELLCGRDLVGGAGNQDRVRLFLNGNLHAAEPRRDAAATLRLLLRLGRKAGVRVGTGVHRGDLRVGIGQQLRQVLRSLGGLDELTVVRQRVAVRFFVFEVIDILLDLPHRGRRVLHEQLVGPECLDVPERPFAFLDVRLNIVGHQRLERNHDRDNFRIRLLGKLFEADAGDVFLGDLLVGGAERERAAVEPQQDKLLERERTVQQIDHFGDRVLPVRIGLDRQRTGWLHRTDIREATFLVEPVHDLAPRLVLEHEGNRLFGGFDRLRNGNRRRGDDGRLCHGRCLGESRCGDSSNEYRRQPLS